ncbi:hypothetical protein Cfor_11609, partial [Coptotermes formosanus]
TNEVTLLCVVLVVATLFAQGPCNRTTPASVKWRQLLRKTWKDVMRQIDITLRHHERQDYDTIYKQVQTATSPAHAPVANWIPGKGDVRGLKSLTRAQHEAGVYLLKLHSDLQKFEIILEDVARESGESQTLKHMMVSTCNFLKQVIRPLHTLRETNALRSVLPRCLIS